MRQVAWGVHRPLAAVLGLWMAFQSLSGLVLLFGDSIEHWRHPELTRHGPDDRGAAEALAVVRQNYPGEEVGVLATPAVSDGVYVVEVGERETRGSGGVPRSVYVDPAGPRINGSRHHDAGFVPLVRRLHRRFLFDSLFGLQGAWVVGALALAWLGLSIGGVVAAAGDRLGLRWRGDPSVAHGVLGVLLVAPIVLVVVTGIRLALPAGTDRIWAAVTGSGLARSDVAPEGVRITSEDRGGSPRNATEVLGTLGVRYPDGRVARLLMPRPDDRVAPVIAGLSAGFDPGHNEHDYGGNTVVFLDQYTAETLWRGNPDALPAARQAAVLWSRPLHTGSVAGEPGRLVWGGLAIALVTLTALGLLSGRARPVAVRRRRRSVQRQLRRRKALARRRRIHAARAARAARHRRRTSRRLRRRRKVQARTLARMGRTA
ncbi:MAG TPA: PepSY-associated TM helix domain-containing protein, partial [Acidimicrobiia bacterium]|nr:PepSY-associated TM helix domain-containing protein [Acidimicrobiia bacterium]